MKSKKIGENEWWGDHWCYLRVEMKDNRRADSGKEQTEGVQALAMFYLSKRGGLPSKMSLTIPTTPLAHGTSFSKS